VTEKPVSEEQSGRDIRIFLLGQSQGRVGCSVRSHASENTFQFCQLHEKRHENISSAKFNVEAYSGMGSFVFKKAKLQSIPNDDENVSNF